MKKLVYLLVIVSCWNCSHDAGKKKNYSASEKVINVHEKVKEIPMEEVLIGSMTFSYIMDDYLIIHDLDSQDTLVHFINKNNFKYVNSAIRRGQGPGEITYLYHIGIDEAKRIFYVSDYGKQMIFSYNLDSVLANQPYMPKEKMNMKGRPFPISYQYFNDTLCIGRFIDTAFKETVAKWNMTTGEMVPMKYEHPEIEDKIAYIASSLEHGIYVECYQNYDLMSICSLNGELKYNLYGPTWTSRKSRESYFLHVEFCGDKIFALYYSKEDTNAELPSKFLVFNTSGDHIQTLETGYEMYRFCYDKDNNRIIMSMDDDFQFAYLDLDEVGM
ncbi:hypothetical protein FACS1894195_5380 [Bacteroidia bacterium]|nr:hypothetical protein FACS1894195_5380 [Bacteroidia bacterium]